MDRSGLPGSVNLVATVDGTPFADRSIHPNVAPHAQLPDDTRLWAALQRASGGTWAGAVYDVDKIIAVIEAGMAQV